MSGTRARLIRVLTAQIYGQGVSIAVQLGLVPVLLAAWGVKTYGTWLLISAVPTYLAFSDLGFTYVAKNVMVSQVAAGDRDGAIRTFQSVFAMLNVVAPLVLLVAVVGAWAIDLPMRIGIAGVDRQPALWTLALLVAAVMVYQYFLLVCAGVRSENRAAQETLFAASVRLVEAGGIAVVALAGGQIVAAATATLVLRTGYALWTYGWLRRNSPWLALGHARADRAEVRRLLHPAFAFALIPIAQALMIQGPVLILGALSGPASVVVFATTRTLTRMGTSATNVLNNTFVTEYAYRYGQRRIDAFLALMRRHQLYAAGVAVVYAAGVMVFGRFALGLISHGAVRPELGFLALMIGGVMCEMMSTSLLTPISAANRHPAASHYLLVTSIAGLLACYPATQVGGLDGAAAAVLATQAVILIGFAWMIRGTVRSAAFAHAAA